MEKRPTFDDLRKHYETLTTAELTSEIARLSAVVEASRKPGVVEGPSTPVGETFEQYGSRAMFEMGAAKMVLAKRQTKQGGMKRPPRYRAAFSIRRLAILRGARRVGAGGRT